MLSGSFSKNCSLVQYSSENFEPVRDSGFTAQGFESVYEKAELDLDGQ